MSHKPSCAVYDPCPTSCDCGYSALLLHAPCRQQIEALRAENAALKQQVEQDKRDAERYRWLRNPSQDVGNVIDKRIGTPHDLNGVWEYRAGTELDQAIDAAFKGEQ